MSSIELSERVEILKKKNLDRFELAAKTKEKEENNVDSGKEHINGKTKCIVDY